MDGVRERLGFAGSLRDFFDEIRTNPRYHPKTKEEYARAFADAATAVDAQIPRFFNKVPKTKLVIQPYPAWREQYEAGGSYNQGSPDGLYSSWRQGLLTQFRSNIFFSQRPFLPSKPPV